MSDLIERSEAVEAVNKAFDKETILQRFVRKIAIDAIKEMPSAQPERKKGRWLPGNRPSDGFWVCSKCKFPSEAFAANVLYKFCPNCGAKMEVKHEA